MRTSFFSAIFAPIAIFMLAVGQAAWAFLPRLTHPIGARAAASSVRAIRLINHPHLVGRRSSRGSRRGGRIGRKDSTGSQEQERERKKPYGEKASGYHVEVTSFW